MSLISKQIPEFEGETAWFWWRLNEDSEWLPTKISNPGFVTQPYRKKHMVFADEIGGEWWTEQMVLPPTGKSDG